MDLRNVRKYISTYLRRYPTSLHRSKILFQHKFRGFKGFKRCTEKNFVFLYHSRRRKRKKKAVIDANVVQTLVQHLHCAVFDVKKEAAWAIANATRGSHDQIHFLVSQQCIEPLCELLLCPDTEIVRTCIEGLDNILKVGEVDKDLGKNGGVNLYAHLVCSCGGLEKIENLTCHNNSDIYEKSTKMLRRYWAEDDKHAIQEDGGLPGFESS